MAKPVCRAAPPLSPISQQAKSVARQKRPHSPALQATCQRASGHKTLRAPAAGARGRWAPGVVCQAEVAVAPWHFHTLIEGRLEAQLSARVTQKCWTERSVQSHCTSQGAWGVPSGACSSIRLMAWPHMDPCLRPGRSWDRQTSQQATPSQMFPVNPTALLFLQTPSSTATYSIHSFSLSPSFKYFLKMLISGK